VDIDTERGPLPYREEGQGTEQVEQQTAGQSAESPAAATTGSTAASTAVDSARGEPSVLLLALLGLGIVTVVLGILAFWFAGSVRRMDAIAVQQQAALATAQAQTAAVATQAAQEAKTQEAAQQAMLVAAQATVQAVTARLAEEQNKSAAYSRIVRANQLANNSLLELTQHPQAALLLAIESLRMQRENGEAPLAESVQRLRSILGATGGMPLRTDGETTALAVNSDERWVAAGDDTGNIQLWDLHNLDTAPRLLQGHEGPVFDVAFGTSTTTDNAILYSAGADGTLRRWSWRTGTPAVQETVITGAVSTVPGERQSPLYALAISPDGSRLAAAGEDGDVALWQTSAELADAITLQGHTGAVNTLAFSPDGRQLASAGNDGTVRIWSSKDGEQLALLDAGESSALANFINLVVFSPDGKWLASGSSDGSVRLWRVPGQAGTAQVQANPAVTAIPLLGHAAAVNALAFSPDGNWLASADDGGEVRLWSVGQPDDNILLGRHTGNVRGLAFAEGDSGPVLVSTGYDGEVRLWNYRNPDADPLVVRGHDNAINALAAPTIGSTAGSAPGSTAGRSGLPDMLVTAGYDGSLRVWHTKNPYAEPHQVLRAGGSVADVAVSPDGTQLASITFDDSAIQLWDAQTGTEEKALARGDAPVSAVAYSSARGVLWAGAKDGSIAEWDTQEGVLLRRWQASDDAISTVAENPNGSLLASGGEDSVVRLWDTQSGSLLRELTGHTGAVTGVAFTEDGKSLVSGGEGTGTLRIWDVATGAEKQVLQGPAEGLLDVAVQPHGSWLAGAGKDGAVWVWNADALAFEPARLSRHGTEVNAVNFSADGQVLASAGSDGAVYLWSTVNPSAEPDALAGHGNSVNGISFAPDGTWLVSGSGDGTIRRWSLSIDELIAEACRVAGRNFTLDEWTQYFPTDVSSYRKTCPNLPGPD
jgi:WD40 repeat protein